MRVSQEEPGGDGEAPLAGVRFTVTSRRAPHSCLQEGLTQGVGSELAAAFIPHPAALTCPPALTQQPEVTH